MKNSTLANSIPHLWHSIKIANGWKKYFAYIPNPSFFRVIVWLLYQTLVIKFGKSDVRSGQVLNLLMFIVISYLLLKNNNLQKRKKYNVNVEYIYIYISEIEHCIWSAEIENSWKKGMHTVTDINEGNKKNIL